MANASERAEALLAASGEAPTADVPQEQRLIVLTEILSRFPDLEGRQVLGFLSSSGFNTDKSAALVEAHLEWRKEVFPVQQTEELKRISTSGRFRFLGYNRDRRGVALFNAMQGRFLDGVDPDVVSTAYLGWMDETLQRLDAETDTKFSWIHIAIGGVPPMSWAKGLHPIMEANYPERLNRAIVHVPAALQAVGDTVLSFVSESTRAKFCFASSKEEILELAGIDAKQWPAEFDIDDWNPAQDRWSDTRPNGDHVVYVRQCIEAGSAETINIVVEDGSAAPHWKLLVETYDVQVSVLFEDTDGDSTELLQEKVTSDSEISGEIDPSWRGILRFELDNSYSWWTRKAVVVSSTTRPAS